jgi:hypothetical protein
MKRGEQIRGKLAPFQAVLGITQIVMSVLYVVFWSSHRSLLPATRAAPSGKLAGH